MVSQMENYSLQVKKEIQKAEWKELQALSLEDLLEQRAPAFS